MQAYFGGKERLLGLSVVLQIFFATRAVLEIEEYHSDIKFPSFGW